MKPLKSELLETTSNFALNAKEESKKEEDVLICLVCADIHGADDVETMQASRIMI